MGAGLRAAILGTAAAVLASSAASAVAAPSGATVCREWTNRTQYVAVLCGLDGELRGARLTLVSRMGRETKAARHDTSYHEDDDLPPVKVAQLGLFEPVLPGESLVASWTALRGPGRLRVRVADPLREQRIVSLALRRGDRGARVVVAADGLVTTIAGTRRSTRPVPPLGPGEANGPELASTATTPRLAVEAVLARAGTFGPGYLAALCASLETEVRDTWDALYAAVPRLDAFRIRCPSVIDVLWFFRDNTPGTLGTEGSVRSVRSLSPTKAIVRVRLQHRFKPENRDDPTRVRTDARVLVVREADGRWRVATPAMLLGSSALPGSSIPLPGTVAQLWALRRKDLAQAGRLRRAAAEYAARRQEAVTPVAAGATDCGGGAQATALDPARDGNVNGTVVLTRDQDLLAADLREVRQAVSGGRLCVTARFERPPPGRFDIAVGVVRDAVPPTRLTVEVIDGTAVLVQRGGEGDETIPGVRVTRDGTSLRVLLPAAIDPAGVRSWDVTARTAHPFFGGTLEDTTRDRGSNRRTTTPSAPSGSGR